MAWTGHANQCRLGHSPRCRLSKFFTESLSGEGPWRDVARAFASAVAVDSVAMSSTVLELLPFGAAAAVGFETEASCADFTAKLPDAPSRFGAIGPPADFRARLCSVALPDINVLAGSCTPKAIDHCSRRLTLVIPFGRSETVLRAARKEYRWAAPHQAFFIPAEEPISAESTSGSFLRFDIVEDALTRTAAGMVGSDSPNHELPQLKTARTIPLKPRGANWLAAIRSVCGTIDALGCDVARLVTTGLDDMVLRMVMMMLHPELVGAGQEERRQANGLDLDPLLEWIVANLRGRVTLADMERRSGRTARTLQLAFQKRYGVGPMRWVREQRLDLIHAELLAAPADATVRQIVAACGMPRMATLVKEYAARFGELPSDTLRRRRG